MVLGPLDRETLLAFVKIFTYLWILPSVQGLKISGLLQNFVFFTGSQDNCDSQWSLRLIVLHHVSLIGNKMYSYKVPLMDSLTVKILLRKGFLVISDSMWISNSHSVLEEQHQGPMGTCWDCSRCGGDAGRGEPSWRQWCRLKFESLSCQWAFPLTGLWMAWPALLRWSSSPTLVLPITGYTLLDPVLSNNGNLSTITVSLSYSLATNF